MTTAGLLDRSMAGAVCGVVGPPGIGKSRLVGEAVQLAKRRKCRGVFHFLRIPCPRHRVPCGGAAAARRRGVIGLDEEEARARVRAQVPDADPEDLMLFDDLLGIADPDVALPRIDPDARRRRLTSLINAASLARTEPGAVHHRRCALDR